MRQTFDGVERATVSAKNPFTPGRMALGLLAVTLLAVLAVVVWQAVEWYPRWQFVRRGAGTHLTVSVTNDTSASVGPLELRVGQDVVPVARLSAGSSTVVRVDSRQYAPILLADPISGRAQEVLGIYTPSAGQYGTLEIGLSSRRDGLFEGSAAAGITYAGASIYEGGPWPLRAEEASMPPVEQAHPAD